MQLSAPVRALALALGGLAFGAGAPAQAGGYDTPMLYSARHMGMGGTAIGAVDDPSALFHNPAGLGNIGVAGALADFSLLRARVKGSPLPSGRDTESEPAIAPMFLVGGGYRLADFLVVGAGVYPIASAGATYKIDFQGNTIEDMTRLVFLEASPAVAFDLLAKRLRLGLGYRLTYVNLQRYQGNRSLPQGSIDFDLSGWNAIGFRAGAQYTVLPGLEVGAVYRHQTRTKVKKRTGRALGNDLTDVSTEFMLPSKLGFGVRGDFGDLGAAVDLEYLFNSQNQGYPLKGTPLPTDTNPTPAPVQVENVFEWKNELTVRTGLEYRLLSCPSGEPGPLALRAGYVFDGTTTNPVYPSAFGTPPGPTHVITGGVGYRFGPWQANLAYARRFGEGEVTPEDLQTPGRRTCQFCGLAGNEPYRIGVHGFYVDVSVAID